MTISLNDLHPARGTAPATGKNIDVETLSARFSFPCQPGDSILSAALGAGFSVPYECATGTCGSCHARVMSGTVDPGWTQAPGYAKLRPENGDILMCQANPLSDCMLRVRSRTNQPADPAPEILHRSGIITKIERLVHDVMHFEVDLSEAMDFQAGQFVTLKAPGVIGRRAYSMVNYSPRARRLTFVVKRKPGGGFSDWLFNGDVSGCRLDITGPLGKATFRPEEDRNIVCIAGGSGIAGMVSMVEHAVGIHYFEARRGHIFFGVRSLADAFYIDRLARSAEAAGPNLKVVLALSHEDISKPNHPEFPDIALDKGFVHDVASARMAGRWDHVAGFVAGPEPMVNAALKVLIAEAGLPPAFIRYDKFS
jgi:toluene monooxygenase electron transfer component